MLPAEPKFTIEKLVPVLSFVQKQEIGAYYAVYKKYEEIFTQKIREDLKDHPVFGKLIRDIPKEVSDAQNKISRQLQQEAIVNGNWRPYIEYQVAQGYTYAQMGLEFKSWFELVAMVKDYITPYLYEEYKNGAELLQALNGMNRFMDIAMGIIGEAYIEEKNGIIKNARDRLSSIFETTADGIFVLEVEATDRYKFSTVNKAFQILTGISNNEVIGKYADEIIPTESLNPVLGKYNEARDGKKVVRWEETLQFPLGWLTVEISIAPYFDEAGNCVRFVGLIHDISEMKKAEERQNLFVSIVNSSDDAIFSKTLDGIITSWNHGAEKVFEYTSNEIIGKNISILVPPHLEKEEQEMMESIRRGEYVDHYETERIRKDGKVIQVSQSISPIRDSFGNIVGASKISRDITERKKLETERKRALELTMANKVLALQNDEKEKRTTELAFANNELKQAEARLISANEELEAFSYSVSHDLRAPLRGINGYAQILKEDYGDKLDEEAGRVINNIMKNARKMGQLIDDLLAYSRLGRRELQMKDINMGNMVNEAWQELVNDREHSNIELVVKPLLPAKADNIAIRQVWLNLISNAIKYSKRKEKAVVEIGSEITGNEIIYSVKDNGVGFDMRYVNKLFGVFQRLHTDQEFEGTGVGLALVQRVICKHGGRVWAEGKVNEGAAFYFTLNKA